MRELHIVMIGMKAVNEDHCAHRNQPFCHGMRGRAERGPALPLIFLS